MQNSTSANNSMIFKTFDNDIDKISAKWGIFGKSFYDFVDIANKRKIKIDDLITYQGMSLEEAKNEVGSLWSNLFPSKKDLQIDIDSLIPEFDTSSARLALEELQNIQTEINNSKGSWDDYHEKFKDGKEYLLDYAKTNNVLEASVDDVKQANQQARQSALAHNAALKQQTLGAKAASVAMKGLAIAGNMAIGFGVAWGITQIIKGIDYLKSANERYIEQQDEIISKAEDVISSTTSRIDSLEDLKEKLDETNGSQSELLKLTDDINNVLGDGKSKILDNANALAILNAEIKNELKLEKERQNLANQEKRNASFNKAKKVTSTETTNFDEEFTFKDIQNKYNGGIYVKIGDTGEYYEDIGQIINKYIEQHLANGDELSIEDVVDYYDKAISAFNLHSFNGIKISKKEMTTSMETALKDLYVAFEDVINNGEGFLSKSYKQNIIDALYLQTGGVIDDEWRNKVYETINFLDTSSDDIHKALEEYNLALNDDIEGNEDIVYENILSIFDNIKQQYPIISSIIDSWLSDMIAELQETSLDNHDDGILDSFADKLASSKEYKDYIEEFQTLMESANLSSDILSSTEEYATLLEKLGFSAEDAATSLKKFFGELKYVNMMDGMEDTIGTVIEAQQELGENNKLSFDTTKKLLTIYPELEGELQAVEGGYEVTNEVLQNLIDTKLASYKLDTNEVIDAVNKVIAAQGGEAIAYSLTTDEIIKQIEAQIALLKSKGQVDKVELPTGGIGSFAPITIGGFSFGNKLLNNNNLLSQKAKENSGIYKEQNQINELETLLKDLNSSETNYQNALEIYEALKDKIKNSSGSGSSSSSDPWKQAFEDELAELKHALEMNWIDEADYYVKLDQLNKKYFKDKKEYLDEYRDYEEEVYKGMLSLQDDALEALHKLIDLRVDMIKDMKQDEIDALEDIIDKEKEKLDLINEQIDARKEALETLKDEKDHQEELSERNKSISDIQIQLEALKYDNSASAQKKRRELEEELAEAQKDLADYIADYEYDKEIERLDKESELAEKAYEEEEERLQAKIDDIQAFIDDEMLLMEQAINDINGMNNTLYEQMKQWAKETTGEVWTVVDAWKEAKDALERYNSVNRVPEIHTELHENADNNIATSYNGLTSSGGNNTPISTPTTSTPSTSSSLPNNDEKQTEYKAIHTVTKGETLWGIAKKYYGDGTKWTKIQEANGNIDPKYLTVGKKLYIPYKNGTTKVPKDTLALVDEVGQELILRADEKGRLDHLTMGSSVIPADATEKLLAWAQYNPDMFMKNLVSLPKFDIPNIIHKDNTPSVNIGDIYINGNMGNLTKTDLNNFRKDIVNDVFTTINKSRLKSGR